MDGQPLSGVSEPLLMVIEMFAIIHRRSPPPTARGILALVLCFAIPGELARAQTQSGLTDNFSADSALNTSLWTQQSPLLNRVASIGESCFSLPNKFMPPVLSFGSGGMQMSGTNAWQQTTGIQSLNTFSPPFTFETTVTAMVANGNPFEIFFVSADGRQLFSFYGNANPANGPYVGIKIGCQVFYATPQVGVGYTIDITATPCGLFQVSLKSGTTLLASTSVRVGTGPFYLILGQGEGWPNTGGTKNVSVWQSATVETSTPSANACYSLAVKIVPVSDTYMLFGSNDMSSLQQTIVSQLESEGVTTSSMWIGFGVANSTLFSSQYASLASDLLALPGDSIQVASDFEELGIVSAAFDWSSNQVQSYALSSPPDVVVGVANAEIHSVTQAQAKLFANHACAPSGSSYTPFTPVYLVTPSQYLVVLVTGLSGSDNVSLNLSNVDYGYAAGLGTGGTVVCGTSANSTPGYLVADGNAFATPVVSPNSGQSSCPQVSATMLDSNGKITNSAEATVNCSNTPPSANSSQGALPTVSGIRPQQGTAGTTVTISGSGFVANGTTVTFQGLAPIQATVNSPSQITVTVPDDPYWDGKIVQGLTASGTLSVTVTTTAGTSQKPIVYYYTGSTK